jgi:hypothetical protein
MDYDSFRAPEGSHSGFLLYPLAIICLFAFAIAFYKNPEFRRISTTVIVWILIQTAIMRSLANSLMLRPGTLSLVVISALTVFLLRRQIWPHYYDHPVVNRTTVRDDDIPVKLDRRSTAESISKPLPSDVKSQKGSSSAELDRVLEAFAATRSKPHVRKAIRANIREALQAKKRLASLSDRQLAETEFQRMLSVVKESRRACVERWEDSYEHPQWVSAVLAETLFSNELSRLQGKISRDEYQTVLGNIARFAE